MVKNKQRTSHLVQFHQLRTNYTTNTINTHGNGEKEWTTQKNREVEKCNYLIWMQNQFCYRSFANDEVLCVSEFYAYESNNTLFKQNAVAYANWGSTNGRLNWKFNIYRKKNESERDSRRKKKLNRQTERT